MDHLKPIDFLVLLLCQQFLAQHQKPPQQYDIYHPKTKTGLLNQYLVEQDIDPFYARPLTGKASLYEVINRLRSAGLMDKDDYAPTEEGINALHTVGDDVTKMPIKTPIQDGKPNFAASVYVNL